MANASLAFDILARDRASAALNNVGKSSDKLHSKLSGLAKGALIGGVAGAAAGVAAGLAKVVSTGLGEYKDYQAGLSQLNAGLKSTGNVAGISATQMENLASSIQSYSGQTDDSIVKTESLLLTFTNIRNQAGKNNDVFTQTTKIAADMAARMGGDATGAAIQLGKALNDPVKGITALTRVGVSFTQQQKDQIAQLVKSGHTLQAQKVILGELNKEFGGSAKAYGQTLPGMIDRGKRAFEDFSQNLVQKAIPVVTSLAQKVIPQVQAAFRSISDTIDKHRAQFEQLATLIRTVVAPVIEKVAAFAFKVWATQIKTALTILADVTPVLKVITKAFLQFVGFMIDTAAKAFGWIPGIGPKLRKAAKEFDHFRDSVNNALNGIKSQKLVTVQTQYVDPAGHKTGAPIKLMASGGPVTGGIPGVDSVPAMLMPGEFVVRRDRSNLAEVAGGGRGGPLVGTMNVYTNRDERVQESVPRGLRSAMFLAGVI